MDYDMEQAVIAEIKAKTDLRENLTTLIRILQIMLVASAVWGAFHAW